MDNYQPPDDSLERLKKYRDAEEIGEGSFGVIRKMVDSNTQKTVAVKQITPKEPKHYALVDKEFQIMNYLKDYCDEYFICVIDYLEKQSSLYIIMEFNEKYLDLEKFVKQKYSGLTKSQIRTGVENIIKSINKLHSVFVYHSDIKPQNILINTIDQKIKLIDFGLAEFGRHDQTIEIIIDKGTAEYQPPEYKLNKLTEPYRLKDIRNYDIWATGLSIYYLILGEWFFTYKLKQLGERRKISNELRINAGIKTAFREAKRNPTEQDSLRKELGISYDELEGQYLEKKYPNLTKDQIIEEWYRNGYNVDLYLDSPKIKRELGDGIKELVLSKVGIQRNQI